MKRDGEVIGVIAVARPVAGPFPRHQVELLKSYADQAVIAIENARLFNETKVTLERQKATSESCAQSPTHRATPRKRYS